MKYAGSMLGIDAAGVVVCAALAAGVYMTAVLPSRAAAAAAAQDREALCEKQKDIAMMDAGLQASKKLLEELTANAAGDKSQALTSLDRISRISQLAANTGVAVIELSPRAEKTGTKYNQSPVTLRGSGRLPGFTALLRELHREFPDTQLVSLSITGNPEQRGVDQAMSADLVWYTLAGGSDRAGFAGAKPAPKPATP